MKVKTTRFGEIEIKDEDILHVPAGLPGFPDEHRFVLIPYAENSPFVYLQSATEDYLAFLMTEPFRFFKDYEFEIDEASMKELEISDEKQIYTYVMVTVPRGNAKAMTANLVAPFIINIKEKRAKQVVLEKSAYHTKHPVFEHASAAEGGS